MVGRWKCRAAVAIIAMAGMLLGPAHGQTSYPTRQVRIVVAFAPGGIADVLARVIGQKLSAKFDQTFIIENRSGAGGR
jgi:tripartite-type tricarboxylate transporter receptor subunit TctC